MKKCVLRLCFAAVLSAEALRLQLPSRRSAIGAAIGAAIARDAAPVQAYDYTSAAEGGGVTYKQRNYGDEAKLGANKKMVCEEGLRKQPDGFGGFKCVGQVKSVGERVGEGVSAAVEGLVSSDAPDAPDARDQRRQL